MNARRGMAPGGGVAVARRVRHARLCGNCTGYVRDENFSEPRHNENVKDRAFHSSPTLGRMSWEPRQSLTPSEFRKQANRKALERIPKDLYWKVAGLSFVVGACMELFMIKTGFYEKVTAIEAERREALSEPPAWVLELQEQHKAATEKKK